MKTSWLLVPLFAASLASAATNLVEPLSNGLQLSMTGPEIKNKFGAPAGSFDARTLNYPGWTVQVGGRREEIWHLTLKKDVKLACGIGPGSSRADVQRAFGAADRATSGQYKLAFSYDGDVVREIKIDPAGSGFVPAGTEATAPATKKRAGIAGTWHGSGGTMGLLELKPNGTYTSPNGGKGRWKATSDGVRFTGALKAWNGGEAKFTSENKDTLEFHWQDEKGNKHYFAFSKD